MYCTLYTRRSFDKGELGGRPIYSKGSRLDRIRRPGALLRVVDRGRRGRAALLTRAALRERAGGAQRGASVDRDRRAGRVRALADRARGGPSRRLAAALAAAGRL